MNSTLNATADLPQTIQAVAHTTPQGFSFVLIGACFAFMIWQSWLQYKTKSKNDVEIDNLKLRLDSYDQKIGKLFNAFEQLLATCNRIDGMLSAQASRGDKNS